MCFSRTQQDKKKKKRDPGFGQAHVRHVLAVSAAILEGPGALAYEMQGREARSTYRNRELGKCGKGHVGRGLDSAVFLFVWPVIFDEFCWCWLCPFFA